MRESTSSPWTIWLRAALFLQCAAAAHMAWQSPTALNGALFVTVGWPEVWCDRIDRGAALMLPLLALVLVARPRRRMVAFTIGLWFLLDAIATVVNGGARFTELSLASRAVRYATPIVLAWLCVTPPRRAATTALRVSVAAVFVAHGWKAFQHHAPFQDLVWAAAMRVEQLGVDARPAPAAVDALLTVIGVQDLCLALALLFAPRIRVVPLYMAAWGAITATSRVLLLGAEGIDDALLRALNACAPLYLYLTIDRSDVHSSDDSIDEGSGPPAARVD